MRVLVACLAVGALLTACGREDHEASTATGTEATREAHQPAPAWVAQARARVTELRERISRLEARAPDVPAEYRERFDSTVKDLRQEADELDRDLRKAAQDADADWDALRDDVNDEFREMGRKVDETSVAVGSAKELFNDTRQTIGAWLQEAGAQMQPAPRQADEGTRPEVTRPEGARPEGTQPAPADRPGTDHPNEMAPPR
jgi:hypothetical protein